MEGRSGGRRQNHSRSKGQGKEWVAEEELCLGLCAMKEDEDTFHFLLDRLLHRRE